MRVLILGAGIVGYTLAEQLSKEKHDIYVIEQDSKIIKIMNDNLDLFASCGSGTSQSVLEAIGVQDMDLMIAVTNSDEVNILSSLMASQYGVKKLVVRVKNPEYVSKHAILQKSNTGVDLFINPVSIVVQMIEQLIEVPGCTDVAYVGDGEMQIRGFEITEDSKLLGQTISSLHEMLSADAFCILAISRNNRTRIPNPETKLSPGDRIIVLVSSHTLNMFLPMLMPKQQMATNKIILFGASITSIELAKRLEKTYRQVVLLEMDPQKCIEVSQILNKTLVIQGSALDKDTLKEIVVETADVFACLSEKDEDNFMAAMMAKQYGAKRTVVLTEQPAYLEILDKSNIDILINPRLITVGKILQFLRRGPILSAAKLIEGEAEVLEYKVEDNSPLVGKSIKTLNDKKLMPKGATIAAINDGEVIIVPEIDTIINSGDRVVLFVLPVALEKVQNLLSGKKWKFA
jgi:trk system potassium uptake protein TrkA